MKILVLLLFSFSSFFTQNFNNQSNEIDNSVNLLNDCNCKWDMDTNDCWSTRGNGYCFMRDENLSGLCSYCVIIGGNNGDGTVDTEHNPE